MSFYDEYYARYGDAKRFVSNLKKRMDLHGISRAQLAERSGFSPVHLSYWLGKAMHRTPSVPTMVVLDETVDRLISGD